MQKQEPEAQYNSDVMLSQQRKEVAENRKWKIAARGRCRNTVNKIIVYLGLKKRIWMATFYQ